MVSTSGTILLPDTAINSLRTRLLRLTTILTPNIPEAKLLLRDTDDHLPNLAKYSGSSLEDISPERNGRSLADANEEIQSLDDLLTLAKYLSTLMHPEMSLGQGPGPGRGAVLLKGGHLPLSSSEMSHLKHVAGGNMDDSNEGKEFDAGNYIFNILQLPPPPPRHTSPSRSHTTARSIHSQYKDEASVTRFSESKRQEQKEEKSHVGRTIIFQSPHTATRNTHGTGCSLASAIAANLALAHQRARCMRTQDPNQASSTTTSDKSTNSTAATAPTTTTTTAIASPHAAPRTDDELADDANTDKDYQYDDNDIDEDEALIQAVEKAIAYVSGAIIASRDWRLGHGSGPVDHFWNIDPKKQTSELSPDLNRIRQDQGVESYDSRRANGAEAGAEDVETKVEEGRYKHRRPLVRRWEI